MDKSRINILVVDDERGLCAGVQEALKREGYSVDAANDARTALKLVGERLYNLVLTDVKMPEVSGLQLLQEARQKSADTLFILMTAFGTVESAVEAMKEGAYDYLSKPLDMQRLRALVLKALEFQAVVAENHELRMRLRRRSEPGPLVGDSEGIRNVIRLADEVARSEVTVLIEGESGTGKELIARYIHLKSARADKPFISVNCAALPETLLEAELFGHVKGAFTGAIANKPGRFQLADRGTLFLDEIGDLPAKGQGEAGKFREDLWYRLQIIPIPIPPLRERAEDIPLLIESFLEHFTTRHKRRRKTLSTQAMQLCQRFPWPGNVRQLRNVTERLVLTCHKPTIEISQLPDFLRAHDKHSATFTIRPGMALVEVEKLLIRQTLTHVTSNREEAAKLLGISRRSLQYKLKRYGLLGDEQAATE